MSKTNFQELLDAGVHFGHLKRKWNPAMAPYIFMERNGIHIFDLHKTAVKIDEAANAIRQIAKSGRKILFVATKKQAKEIIAEKAQSVNMPYVVERWPGGMLTNFPTIRKAVKKMSTIDRLMSESSWNNLSKREKLQITRQRAKLEKNLGSIVDMTKLPAAMFIVDVMKEHIAVKEAIRLSIPLFGIVDTNSDPTNIDFVIPANDDATSSIELIMGIMTDAMKEGLAERKVDKEPDPQHANRPEREIKVKGEKRAKLKARKEEAARKEAVQETKSEKKSDAPLKDDQKKTARQRIKKSDNKDAEKVETIDKEKPIVAEETPAEVAPIEEIQNEVTPIEETPSEITTVAETPIEEQKSETEEN